MHPHNQTALDCHTHQPLCGVANDNHSCCDRHLYVHLKCDPYDAAIRRQRIKCFFRFDDTGVYLRTDQDAAMGKDSYPLIGFCFQFIEEVADTLVLHGE